jgi:uncharacterized OB-fold protein
MTEGVGHESYGLDPYVLSHPQSKPFWRAAGEGRLILPSCSSCGRVHWYPRSFCPLCHSFDLEWVPATGNGVVYSFSVMRRAKPEYIVALITLDEGPTLMTNLVECEPASLAIGQRVKAVFIKTPEGRHVPVFKPE